MPETQTQPRLTAIGQAHTWNYDITAPTGETDRISYITKRSKNIDEEELTIQLGRNVTGVIKRQLGNTQAETYVMYLRTKTSTPLKQAIRERYSQEIIDEITEALLHQNMRARLLWKKATNLE